VIDCYDLWENYDFNSVPQSVAEKNLTEFKDIVNFKLGDVIGLEKKYKAIDMLHIDLGNDGIILEKIIPRWINKTRLIVIEGGSLERDRVEWMIKFNKIPIKKWLADFTKKRGDIEYSTMELFPSVTIICKVESRN